MYSQTEFPNDENSIHYKIKIFQETINQYIEEYLVNFEYFKQMMENYGFVLVSDEEARHMGFQSGTGLFNDLFTLMENEIKRYPANQEKYGDAIRMTPEERRISFMNRYFIFKKVRHIADSVKIAKLFHVMEHELERAEEKFEEEHDAIRLGREVQKVSERTETKVKKAMGTTRKNIPEKETENTDKTEKEKEKTKEETAPKKVRKTQKIKKVKFVIDKYSPIIESLEGDK